jgi:hypothetical protein
LELTLVSIDAPPWAIKIADQQQQDESRKHPQGSTTQQQHGSSGV